MDDEEYVWNVWKVLKMWAAVAFIEAATVPVITDGLSTAVSGRCVRESGHLPRDGRARD